MNLSDDRLNESEAE